MEAGYAVVGVGYVLAARLVAVAMAAEMLEFAVTRVPAHSFLAMLAGWCETSQESVFGTLAHYPGN